MIPVLRAAQARDFDRWAAQVAGISARLLMENAGAGAARAVERRLGRPGRWLVACGPGNNGGDGLVVARHLLTRGHVVQVALFCAPEDLKGDAADNLQAWRGLGGSVEVLAGQGGGESESVQKLLAGADAAVDALFGTGLSRPLTGQLARGVSALAASGLPIYALDLPSGLHADTGCVQGLALNVDATLTFGHPKCGLLTTAGAAYAGDVEIIDLGVPAGLGPGSEPAAHWLEGSDVARWLDERSPAAHKGQAGRVAVVAGSPGKTGAALLATRAALRAGAGLVTACAFADTARTLERRVEEAMTFVLDDDDALGSLATAVKDADVVVVGPGLGRRPAARAVVEWLAFEFPRPVVLDADAITLLSEERVSRLAAAAGPRLLTPHPGELARLLGTGAAEVEADRFGSVDEAAALTGQTVLLKGPHTLIAAPGATTWVSSAGHRALATGGSGDVLAGICGALAVPRRPLERVAALAAHLHGCAARRWVKAHAGADRGLLAGELVDELPHARASLAARAQRVPN